ncbi:MAG: D-glycero-beta-D-manno-heptose 1,7-bisphosphate 7-phosphatase [Desulfuromonadales bacterium]|nr:D-glycero-beta-D-manno-heptose 1,7-bisphosphate 7-phosphatase [Desulfuromonadales bacterium]
MRRAVFLDRDGTINQEKEYLYRIEEFEFVPGAPEAIRMLNQAGFFVVVVTNQSGVGRGYYTEDDVETLHHHISQELEQYGARVDAWMYCPHHPAGKGSYSLPCTCRKPQPGMLLEAARRFGLLLEQSVMIGDKSADISAARAAGCRPILVRSGYGAAEESCIQGNFEVYDDLLCAAISLCGSE